MSATSVRSHGSSRRRPRRYHQEFRRTCYAARARRFRMMATVQVGIKVESIGSYIQSLVLVGIGAVCLVPDGGLHIFLTSSALSVDFSANSFHHSILLRFLRQRLLRPALCSIHLRSSELSSAPTSSQMRHNLRSVLYALLASESHVRSSLRTVLFDPCCFRWSLCSVPFPCYRFCSSSLFSGLCPTLFGTCRFRSSLRLPESPLCLLCFLRCRSYVLFLSLCSASFVYCRFLSSRFSRVSAPPSLVASILVAVVPPRGFAMGSWCLLSPQRLASCTFW